MDEALLLAEGKADDYYSSAGLEFDVRGSVPVTLVGEDAFLTGAARLQRVKELAQLRVQEITRDLDKKLWEIFPEERRLSSHLAAMIRYSTTRSEELIPIGQDRYQFTYKAQIGGPEILLIYLPSYGSMKPSTLRISGVDLEIKPAAATADSYPDYRALLEGGLDIALHFGFDDSPERFDMIEARIVFAALPGLGFRSPAESFEELDIDSGPFVRELSVDDAVVPIRLRLYHADMSEGDRPRLLEAFRTSAAEADIVIYKGHAGPAAAMHGVSFHDHPSVSLPANRFRLLPLADKYQLFLFDGCNAYGYADHLLSHPGKTSANLDVITTINYSCFHQAEVVLAFFGQLLMEKKGQWMPRPYSAILGQLNRSYCSWRATYGVHGAADNPRISPLGDRATIGLPCEEHSDCPGIDNLCLKESYLSTRRSCGVACLGEGACPAPAHCEKVWSSLFSMSRQCVMEMH